MANTHTTSLHHFQVYRDGKLDKELTSSIGRGPGIVKQARGFVSLQCELLRYDLLHGTHYRRTYNVLKREQKNRAFEARLGLVRIDAKTAK